VKVQAESLKSHISALEASLKASQQEKAALEGSQLQLALEKERLFGSSKALEDAQEENSRVKGLLAEKDKEIARLEKKVEDEKKRTDKYRHTRRGKDLEALEEMIAKTSEKFESMSQELLTLKSEHEKKIYEVQTLRKELEFLTSHKTSLEGEVSEGKQRFKELEEELKATKTERERQHREYDTLTNRFKSAKSECKDLKKEIDDVKTFDKS
jgi:chromosome segregation ATPase